MNDMYNTRVEQYEKNVGVMPYSHTGDRSVTVAGPRFWNNWGAENAGPENAGPENEGPSRNAAGLCD